MKAVHRALAHRPLASLAVAVLVLAACADGRSDYDADTDQAMVVRDTSGMMSGMQDMGRGGTMGQMEAHLRTMEGVDADSLHAMLPTHRLMVTNMIAQFNEDMRGTGSPENSAWVATVDSLRQDLLRMSEMTASEHQQYMAGHVARVRRVMGAHGTGMDTLRR